MKNNVPFVSVTLHDIVHTEKSLTLVFEYLEKEGSILDFYTFLIDWLYCKCRNHGIAIGLAFLAWFW